MAASVPVFVTPVMVMVLLVPTFLLSKVPVVDAVEMVTVSPLMVPTNAADPRFRDAVVFWSYVLLLAVMPDTVSVFAVMSAVAVG